MTDVGQLVANHTLADDAAVEEPHRRTERRDLQPSGAQYPVATEGGLFVREYGR